MWYGGDTSDDESAAPWGTRPGAAFKLPIQLVLNLPKGPDVTAHFLHGWDPK